MTRPIRFNSADVHRLMAAYDGASPSETDDDLSKIIASLREQGIGEDIIKIGPKGGLEIRKDFLDAIDSLDGCIFLKDGLCSHEKRHAWNFITEGTQFCGPNLRNQLVNQCKEREV